MPRRVSLPGASELFRGTPVPGELTTDTPDQPVNRPTKSKKHDTTAGATKAAATGRVRHDEKITVYVSRDELLALEQGRLQVRRDFSLAVDRGRLVRESIAIVMEDLAAHGEDSELIRRLRRD